MYEKILLAADGSRESKLAAREVNKFVQMGVAKKVMILYVVQEHIEIYDNMAVSIDIWYKEAMALGKSVLGETRDLVGAQAECEEKLLIGNPARLICEEAEKLEVDMIAMGSRGKNPLSGLFLGSVSTRVLQCAPCPVFIVKNNHNFPE